MWKRVFVVVCAFAVACGQPGKSGKPSDVSGVKTSAVIAPAPQFIDHALLGSELGSDGTVSKASDQFAPGQPVYLTIVLRESPTGLQTGAVWTDAEKKELAVERKQMKGTKVATFALRDPKLKPGHYRVTAYWGGNIAAEQEFDVVAAAPEAKRHKG